MSTKAAIMLFVDDRPVLASLQFALAVEGLAVTDAAAGGAGPSAAAALVIDQAYAGDGLAWLARLRSEGCGVPAIVLVTHPTVRLRARAAALGAILVDKPLLGDDLSHAIDTALETRKAA